MKGTKSNPLPLRAESESNWKHLKTKPESDKYLSLPIKIHTDNLHEMSPILLPYSVQFSLKPPLTQLYTTRRLTTTWSLYFCLLLSILIQFINNHWNRETLADNKATHIQLRILELLSGRFYILVSPSISVWLLLQSRSMTTLKPCKSTEANTMPCHFPRYYCCIVLRLPIKPTIYRPHQSQQTSPHSCHF